MSTKSFFDAVESGPRPSEQAEIPERPLSPEGSDHPSVAALHSQFGDAVERYEINSGDQHVVFVSYDKNFEILKFLKETPGQEYDFLADVTGVDYGGGRPVQVVYQLWSHPNKRALRVKCEVPEDDMVVGSVVSLWETANWLEREVYDLFGVHFRNHPDHRRILMPEDYAEGHPLRKDFPLRGRFSRAEQTRRALDQSPEHYYSDSLLESGGDPIVLPPEGEEIRIRPVAPVPAPAVVDQPDPVSTADEEE